MEQQFIQVEVRYSCHVVCHLEKSQPGEIHTVDKQSTNTLFLLSNKYIREVIKHAA